MRAFALLPLVATLAAPMTVMAQDHAQDDVLDAGARMLDEGDPAGAVIALDNAVRQLATMPTRRDALAHGYVLLIAAHLALHQDDRARADARRALEASPALHLDPDRDPPQVVEIVSEARASLATATQRAEETRRADAAKRRSHKGIIIVTAGAAVAGAAAAAGKSGSPAVGSSPTTIALTPSTTVAPVPTSTPTPAPANPVTSRSFPFELLPSRTSAKVRIGATGRGQFAARVTATSSDIGAHTVVLLQTEDGNVVAQAEGDLPGAPVDIRVTVEAGHYVIVLQGDFGLKSVRVAGTVDVGYPTP